MKKPSLIAKNKKANFEFSTEESIQAGLVLEGWEIKSIRDGRVQLVDSYVEVRKGEAFLVGALITPLATATHSKDLDARRPRKLLLHKREINRIIGSVEQKGRTVICKDLHWNNGKVKANVALATGKNKRDKRSDVKERDNNREMARVMKGDY